LGWVFHIEDKDEWDSYMGSLSLVFDDADIAATLNPEEGGGVVSVGTLRKRASSAASGLIASGASQKFVLSIEAQAEEALTKRLARRGTVMER